MGWKKKIQDILTTHGAVRSGDLIGHLGFDVSTTGFDLSTRCMSGLKPLNGSFLESRAQRVLATMVERNEVIWQRSANMDNWYKLPGQRFPKEAKPRARSLQSLAKEVLACLLRDLSKKLQDRFTEAHTLTIKEEWSECYGASDSDDCWIQFYPCVISMDEDGWELADGEPTCNWAGHTFTKKYPTGVDAEKIARRILRELKTS